MLLTEIEAQIKPLSRAEKEQLMQDIQKMLDVEVDEQELRKIFKPETVYEIATPMIAPDEDDARAAAQLRKVFEEHSA